MCLPDLIYDLIIRNISLARPADKPNPMWTVAPCKAKKEDHKKDNYKKEDNKKEDKKMKTSKNQMRLLIKNTTYAR